MLKHMFKLIRPKQWVKNIFVLVPLIFSKTFTHPMSVIEAFAALFCFVLASSSVYILNDIIDIEKDKLHETKRLRPLAAGEVPKHTAALVMVVLFIAAIALAFVLNTNVVLCILAYVVLNIFYSLYLKKVAIVDIMIISLGFVIRVITGAAAIDVYISSWVLACAFFISLCLAAGKRKSEKASLQGNSKSHRRVLSVYTDEFLKALIQTSITCTTIAYSLYIILEYEIQTPMITILFVVFGLLRYMQLIFEDDEGRLPEDLILSDKPMIFTIFLFGATWIMIFLSL